MSQKIREHRNGVFRNRGLLILLKNNSFVGGEGGIRTPGTRTRTIDFESTALNHSATSPKQIGILKNGLQRCEKILQRPKNTGPVLQSVRYLQIFVHQF